MGDAGNWKQPESEPKQPSGVLLHHPPPAAGPGLRGAQLPSSYGHGACGSPETVRQRGYNPYREFKKPSLLFIQVLVLIKVYLHNILT